MKRIASLFALVALGLLAFVAHAAPITFFTTLSGPAEDPPNASPGTGTALVVFDPTAHTMSVQVQFSGLLADVTAAHIHCCIDPPGNVGVATPVPTFPGFPSGVTSGTYFETFDLTDAASFNPAFITANGDVAGAEAALFAGLLGGRAYLNIHTTQFQRGEIRGFFGVPEPATLALLGVAALAAATLRRRRPMRR